MCFCRIGVWTKKYNYELRRDFGYARNKEVFYQMDSTVIGVQCERDFFRSPLSASTSA